MIFVAHFVAGLQILKIPGSGLGNPEQPFKRDGLTLRAFSDFGGGLKRKIIRKQISSGFAIPNSKDFTAKTLNKH